MKIKKTLLTLFMIISVFSITGCTDISDILSYIEDLEILGNITVDGNTAETSTSTITVGEDKVTVVRTTITKANGERETINIALTYPDKTLSLNYSGWALSLIDPDDDSTTTSYPEPTVTSSDGTITLTYSDRTIEIAPDGTVSITDPDGRVTVTNPDGTDATANNCANDTEYTKISTADELQNIDIDMTAKYCLANDIDLTSVTFTPLGYPTTPITGNDHSFTGTEFTGTLDGNDKKITGLRIQQESNNFIGLFAYIGAGGEVKNLTIENPSIEGNIYVASLVGRNYGTITSVNIEANDGLTIATGKHNTGGLVGGNYGDIENSSSSGTVTGRIGGTGGLVGGNYGDIENSSASGDVEGNINTGGLVGYNASGGTIENSSASGNVEGSSWVGSLVGKNDGGTVTANSSATGTVVGTTYVGGQIGGACSDSSFEPIATAADLQGIDLGTNYCLVNDIDLTGVTFTPLGYPATAIIGNDGHFSGTEFTGTLDGNGKKITGLTITRENDNFIGLFAYIEGGEVKDLTIENPSIAGNRYVGSLVGRNAGTISNTNIIGTEGIVTGARQTGGLVGGNYISASIRESSSSSTVNGRDDTGGLVGDNALSSIEGSYATGTVTGTGDHTGGLVGQNAGDIHNSYASGDVNGKENTGGLVGVNDENNGDIEDSRATGIVTGTGENTGGLVGLNVSFISGSSASGNVNGTAWVGSLVGKNDGGTVTGGSATGTVAGTTYLGGLIGGACSDPGFQPIDTANDLQTIDLSLDYCLVNDIDLTGVSFTPLGYPTTAITGDDDDFTGTQFTGTLDGNDRKITGLTITRENDNFIGLFAYIARQAEVKDLTIENPSIKGNRNVGSLAGQNDGTITSVKIEANEDVTIVTGAHTTGGLVGRNYSGSIQDSHASGDVEGGEETGGLVGRNNGHIQDSYASGDVEGTNYTGGLVGYNFPGGSITNSHTSGDVEGEDHTGGLVGYNGANATIENSSASGDVEGNINSGGLAGRSGGNSSGGNSSGGSITNSYATGAVTGTGRNTGGLVGGNYNASIMNSHASGDVEGNINTGGLAGYNWLTASITNSHAIGNKVEGEENTGGLVGRNYSGASITNSYATTAVNGTGNYTGGLVGRNYSGASITNSYATGTVTGTGDNTGGLVGLNEGSIQDSHAIGNKVEGGSRTGGLVGYNEGDNSSITNSYATTAVTGTENYTGGLVGQNAGDIQNSYANGDVNGENYTGGLVGLNDNNASITKSYSTGTVTGTEGRTGGLVGYNGGNIQDSYATGTVTGTGTSTGGLVGVNGDDASIFRSYFGIATTGQANAVGTGSSSGVTGIRISDIDAGGLDPFESYGVWDFATVWNAEGDRRWPTLIWQEEE